MPKFDTDKLQVTTPSGTTVSVKTFKERRYYENKLREYMKFQITHQADLDMLETLLFLMLINYRISEELARDSDSLPVSEFKGKTEILMKNSQEIRYLMEKLEISANKRAEREDKATIAGFIEELKKKAILFKMSKDRQKEFALRFMAGLSELLRLRITCDAEEKDKLRINDDQIFDKLYQQLADYEKIDSELKDRQKKWDFLVEN